MKLLDENVRNKLHNIGVAKNILRTNSQNTHSQSKSLLMRLYQRKKFLRVKEIKR